MSVVVEQVVSATATMTMSRRMRSMGRHAIRTEANALATASTTLVASFASAFLLVNPLMSSLLWFSM